MKGRLDLYNWFSLWEKQEATAGLSGVSLFDFYFKKQRLLMCVYVCVCEVQGTMESCPGERWPPSVSVPAHLQVSEPEISEISEISETGGLACSILPVKSLYSFTMKKHSSQLIMPPSLLESHIAFRGQASPWGMRHVGSHSRSFPPWNKHTNAPEAMRPGHVWASVRATQCCFR